MAARLKIGIVTKKNWGIAFLGDARSPTGNTKNFQGARSVGFQAIGIVSAQFANFGPHANLGYFYHAGERRRTMRRWSRFGFDQLMASWATLVVDSPSRSGRWARAPRSCRRT